MTEKRDDEHRHHFAPDEEKDLPDPKAEPHDRLNTPLGEVTDDAPGQAPDAGGRRAGSPTRAASEWRASRCRPTTSSRAGDARSRFPPWQGISGRW